MTSLVLVGAFTLILAIEGTGGNETVLLNGLIRKAARDSKSIVRSRFTGIQAVALGECRNIHFGSPFSLRWEQIAFVFPFFKIPLLAGSIS